MFTSVTPKWSIQGLNFVSRSCWKQVRTSLSWFCIHTPTSQPVTGGNAGTGRCVGGGEDGQTLSSQCFYFLCEIGVVFIKRDGAWTGEQVLHV